MLNEPGSRIYDCRACNVGSVMIGYLLALSELLLYAV
jgi:hypothetical protein